MNGHGPSLELRCPRCAQVQVCGPPLMLARLRQLGMFKRAEDPPSDVIAELFLRSADRFRCDQCGTVGLVVGAAADDWEATRHCVACAKPISKERLSVVPDATRCAACQAKAESGSDETPEYCPRCGTPMVLRLRGGHGITRYVMACPACGKA